MFQFTVEYCINCLPEKNTKKLISENRGEPTRKSSCSLLCLKQITWSPIGKIEHIYLVSCILGQMYLVCGMLGLVCHVYGILG